MIATRARIGGVIAVSAALSVIGVIGGCQGVADLNVSYADDGSPDGASAGDSGTPASNSDGGRRSPADDGAAADHDELPPMGGAVDGGCTCETRAGLGCCVQPGDAGITCTTSASCAALWTGCQAYDPTTDSYCCWNRTSASYASTCAGKSHACMSDSDCPAGSGTCHARSCSGLTIGVCAAGSDAPPACPP